MVSVDLGSIFSGIGSLVTNSQNFELQQEAFEYQKYLNERQEYLSNTAIQRRVADAEAAGFDKLLALNSGGAGTVSYGTLNAPQKEFADFSGTLATDVSALASTIQSMALTDSQIENVKANTIKTIFDSNVSQKEAEKLLSDIKLNDYNMSKIYQETENLKHNEGVAKRYGVPVGVDPSFNNWFGLASRLMNFMLNPSNNFKGSNLDKEIDNYKNQGAGNYDPYMFGQ